MTRPLPQIISVVYQGPLRFSLVQRYLATFQVTAEPLTARKIILSGSRANMVRAIGSIGEPVFVAAGSNLLQTGPQILEMESVQANSLRSWPPRPIVDGWVDERDYEPAFEEDEWGEGFEDDPANPDA